jgi:hypothetical protein
LYGSSSASGTEGERFELRFISVDELLVRRLMFLRGQEFG